MTVERLWAPWRMEYILAPSADECVFCRAGEDAEAHMVLFRGERALIMLNAYPYNSGHLLVAPYAHVGNINDLTSEDLCAMTELARVSMLAMERCIHPQGFNVGMNVGRAAGAGIEQHVHLHIVPRWEGDTNFMSVVADTRVVPEALEACHERLAPVIEEVAAELGLITKPWEEQEP